MYTNTGYLNNNTNDIVDLTYPLTVTSCGIYRLVNRQTMSLIRPLGRKDYQLLYISQGIAYFDLQNEKDYKLSSGHIILYRPNQPQRYYYHLKDNPEVYWIHFTGYDVESYLDNIGFAYNDVLLCGSSPRYAELFQFIIRELQQERFSFEKVLALSLQELFLEIHRSQIEGPISNHGIRADIAKAVNYFNEFFTTNINIEEYAKNQHFEVCWFIRNFKKYTGMPPMQYITSIRINKGKELLKGTDYNIQEISTIVGYENPLYFSRIFKNHVGCSPTQYRKNHF